MRCRQVLIQGFILPDPDPSEVVVIVPCMNTRRSTEDKRRSTRWFYRCASRGEFNFDTSRDVKVGSFHLLRCLAKIQLQHASARNTSHAHSNECFILGCSLPDFTEIVKVGETRLQCSKERGRACTRIQVFLVNNI